MKNQYKIPLSFAEALETHYTHLSKVNKGIRHLSMPKALKCVDLAAEQGDFVSIMAFRPELEQVKPYLCRECCLFKRRKRRQERLKLVRKLAKNQKG